MGSRLVEDASASGRRTIFSVSPSSRGEDSRVWSCAHRRGGGEHYAGHLSSLHVLKVSPTEDVTSKSTQYMAWTIQSSSRTLFMAKRQCRSHCQRAFPSIIPNVPAVRQPSHHRSEAFTSIISRKIIHRRHGGIGAIRSRVHGGPSSGII